MRNFKLFIFTLFVSIFALSCDRVDPGSVGVRVETTGSNAGQMEILEVGRHWFSIGTETYYFPVHEQNLVWTGAEAIEFNDKQGATISTDISISLQFSRNNIINMFKRYRKTSKEIIDGPVRNLVRNGFSIYSAKLSADEILSTNKQSMLDSVLKYVKANLDTTGIIVTRIQWSGQLRFQESIQQSIDSKIRATQIAVQRENELRETEAMARKRLVEAQTDSIVTVMRAKASAEANRLLNQSLTPIIIQKMWLEKWNGVLPVYSGTGGNINLMVPQHPSNSN